jgi:hypothetical protein
MLRPVVSSKASFHQQEVKVVNMDRFSLLADNSGLKS